MALRLLHVFSVVALLFSVVGCGPKLAPVSGRVTLAGEPAEGLRVLFMPIVDTPTAPDLGFGVTDRDGSFFLRLAESKRTGVVPGNYAVMIKWDDDTKDCPYKIPGKATHGELRFTVPPSGTDQADFKFTTEEMNEEHIPGI